MALLAREGVVGKDYLSKFGRRVRLTRLDPSKGRAHFYIYATDNEFDIGDDYMLEECSPTNGANPSPTAKAAAVASNSQPLPEPVVQVRPTLTKEPVMSEDKKPTVYSMTKELLAAAIASGETLPNPNEVLTAIQGTVADADIKKIRSVYYTIKKSLLKTA